MTRKLLLATAVVALMTAGALAQTVNNAPQNSPAGVADQTKQAPRTGDTSQVGGTPSANTKGLQSQMQDPANRDAVTIAPEQRTKIKQYVVQNKVKPYTMRERLAVGTTLPAGVELYSVPNDWGLGLTQYRYIYSGDHIGLVDPSSRRVI